MLTDFIKQWSPPEIRNKIRRRTGYYKRKYIREYPCVKDAVFIWIPKNGGTSMYHALKEKGMLYLTNEDSVRFYFPEKGMATFGPLSYAELLKQKLVSESFNNSAFKYAIARNPYDRAVSSFFYFRQNKWIHPEMSFKAFVEHVATLAFEHPGLSYNTYEGYLYPQVDYLMVDGEIVVDFIARLERIDEGLSVIKNKLGIDFDFPVLNKTEHAVYQSYYCDQTTDMIQKVYRKDFELLDYSYEL